MSMNKINEIKQLTEDLMSIRMSKRSLIKKLCNIYDSELKDYINSSYKNGHFQVKTLSDYIYAVETGVSKIDFGNNIPLENTCKQYLKSF